MKRHGEMTAQMGQLLARSLKPRGYVVHYDHGVTGEDVGTIVSWFEGKEGYGRDSELSQLDIVILDERTKKAVLLIEIEETSDRPKAILGDVFAALLGDGIRFGGYSDIAVDEHTILLVVAISRFGRDAVDEYIEEKVNTVKAALETRNSQVAEALIWKFANSEDLGERLPGEVERLIVAREAELAQL